LRARERESQRAVKEGRADPSDLDVSLHDIVEGGVDVRRELPAERVSALLDDGKTPRWTGRETSSIDVHLESEAGFVRMKGKMSLALSHPCVRCLNDVPFDVDLPVDLRLVQRPVDHERGPIEADFSAGDGDGDDLEGRMLGDPADLEDLDIASFSGDVLHVGDVLREQLFLELPLHPACDSPRAKPAAPCGFDAAALEKQRAAWVDPRWAGLAALREKIAAPASEGAPTEAHPADGSGVSSSLRPSTEAPAEREARAPKKKAKKAPKKTPKKAAKVKKAPAKAKPRLAKKKKGASVAKAKKKTPAAKAAKKGKKKKPATRASAKVSKRR
jgi:uncharacterized metal-binding protein YceD (DUF177 family)